MAIKQRVLAKLAAIETDVHAVAETGNLSLLDAAAKDLETVRGLCHSGLPRQFSVTYNEVFDGIITAVRTLLAGLSNDNPGEVCSLYLELVREIGKSIAKENHFKKEIVFLPYQASMWDSMESVWQAAINDSEHAIAYVVPIPYCDRAPDGGASEWHCEIAKFPLYVPTIDYRYIDLEDMHPDVIIIQNPYDNYNIVTSVDETYYSWNLKKWTNKLVYIPYFMIEEFDPDDEEALEDFSCFVFPGRGVMNADLTIVQSENIREAYIRLLLKRTDKDRAYWEKRILGLGSPKIDKVLATKREDILLPEDWRRVIEKPDGTWKTVVLYNARLGNLLKYKDKLLDKMEWVFQTFQERRDEVALLWRPHPLFEATVKARAPELWARYRWMVERYRREGWGIYDDSTDLHRAIAVSDGYYGDGSSIVCLYKATGKPVLLQDVRTDVGCLRFIGASRLSTTLYFFSLNLAGLFSLRLKDLEVGLVDIFPFT
ncbi:MAG: hypothetical protein IKO94_06680, partial [Selenomonadaceae bacterium]|nr:hypothetical protein [Selenomonadaceae bacterium]